MDNFKAGPARSTLRDRIAFAVMKHFPPDASDCFMKEYGRRRDFERETVAENVVVLIDKILYLTGQQREQIATEIATNWDVRQAEIYTNIPDQFVVPYLQESQKIVWQGEMSGGRQLMICVKDDLRVEVAVPNTWKPH